MHICRFLVQKRLQIKIDRHCLPRAMFTGMKKKNLLPNYLFYKQILCETAKETKLTDKYIIFIADTVNYAKYLYCYEEKENLQFRHC